MKRLRNALSLGLMIASICLSAYAQTAQEILSLVDDNEIYSSISYEAEMHISYQGKTFIKKIRGYGRENKDSFIEFINQEDVGTKYLKKDGRLYVYSPDTEQVMLISGHMLKESMMGSDYSYEDTIENDRLSKRYSSVVSGEEILGDRACWILDLTALKSTESYPTQRLWVSKDTHEVLRFDLFALSGVRVKEYSLLESRLIKNRYFPVKSEMRDLMRKGSKTVFTMDKVELDQKLSDSLFSTRNLR